jgi:hypothetical protein
MAVTLDLEKRRLCARKPNTLPSSITYLLQCLGPIALLALVGNGVMQSLQGISLLANLHMAGNNGMSDNQ